MNSTNHSPTLGLLALLAILAVSGSYLATCPADTDLWGHVQYGRDVLRDGAIPATTTYSYTAEGYRWINHENLAEIILAVGMDAVGPIGMKIGKTCLGILAIAGMIYLGRKQQFSWIALAVTSILVSLNLSHYWILRPQLLTLICLILLVVLLHYGFTGWRDHWHLQRKKSAGQLDPNRMKFLWLAVPLFFVWANSHGGFVAGLCIFAAYLFFRGGEILVQRPQHALRAIIQMGLVLCASALVTVVNPYGAGLHLWLIESLGVPRPEITEWMALDLSRPDAYPRIALFGVFAAVLWTSKESRDFARTMVLLLVLWQATQHMRHLAMFAILFGFWMPLHVHSTLSRLTRFRWDRVFAYRSHPKVLHALVATGLVFVIVLASQRLFLRWTDFRVHRSQYPVSALQFIADNNLQGRMVVTFDWAQYVIGAFGTDDPSKPGIQVGFDGRFRTCYPQEVVDTHFDFILGMDHPDWRWRSPDSPPFDPARVLQVGDPELVLINRQETHSVRVMETQTDQWLLLYQDGLAQLWGRRDQYDPNETGSAAWIQSRISNEPQIGTVTWPAFPQSNLQKDNSAIRPVLFDR